MNSRIKHAAHAPEAKTGAGIDTLIGGAGKDTLKGGSDADLISDSWWHTFDTSLKTDNSNDTLYGEGGDDELVSYDGRDLLDGKMDNQGAHAANDNILHKKLVMIKKRA